MLEIIYRDEFFVAINKPHNLLVHRTGISEEKENFAVQMLKDQLGCWVTPCHRIDRKTSGVLLFAFDKVSAAAMMKSFAEQTVKKEYLVFVRGYLPEEGIIDSDLSKENGRLQNAVTHYQKLKYYELPFQVSRYPSSRYTLAKVTPKTGRMHQIRRHMAHIRHYVIGDKVHGECKHNKFFEENLGLNTMLLHAKNLTFRHYNTGQDVFIEANLQKDFLSLLEKLDSLKNL